MNLFAFYPDGDYPLDLLFGVAASEGDFETAYELIHDVNIKGLVFFLLWDSKLSISTSL